MYMYPFPKTTNIPDSLHLYFVSACRVVGGDTLSSVSYTYTIKG